MDLELSGSAELLCLTEEVWESGPLKAQGPPSSSTACSSYLKGFFATHVDTAPAYSSSAHGVLHKLPSWLPLGPTQEHGPILKMNPGERPGSRLTVIWDGNSTVPAPQHDLVGRWKGSFPWPMDSLPCGKRPSREGLQTMRPRQRHFSLSLRRWLLAFPFTVKR